jgi:hypothetical protein
VNTITVLAHGVGGSSDLPVPYQYAMVGAAWALTFTFAVVAFAWRRPRFDPDAPGVLLPDWVTQVIDAPLTRWCLGALGVLFAAWAVAAGLLGPQTNRNALVGVFYVLLWVGLVAASVALGPIWRLISPMRSVYRILPLSNGSRDYPIRLGYWPAAFGLFAFVWLELASPNPGSVFAVEVWLGVYAVVLLAGAIRFGDNWFECADPFEVYSTAVSRLSPVRRNRRSGWIVLGNPFNNLPAVPIRPGLVTVLAVLLGSTAFDSFSSTPGWRNFADGVASGISWLPFSVAQSGVRTIGLLVFAGVVGVTFSVAARATGGLDKTQRRFLPGELAHSLIPIVVGYIFAHYVSFLVEQGQRTIIALADPFDRGWNLLGLGNAEVTYVLSGHPGVLAVVKVTFVVAGHIAAVIAAHDRALRLLPAGHQITGQLAMMLTMVAYTFTGLYLLFSA